MNYKNAITMTTLSVIAVFAIASFVGFKIVDTDAATMAVQPEKFVFVEKVSTTALFEFKDGSESIPIQQFTQISGFGSKSSHSRQTPTFTLEKIVGSTPYLYAAADEAYANVSGEYPTKDFGVTIFESAGGDVYRSFAYANCMITNYAVATRSDNEEGYTGKGFAVVDQFTIECRGYEPLNPIMDKMNVVEKAKTISSSDLNAKNQWGLGFTPKK
jgi:hypothetical protein